MSDPHIGFIIAAYAVATIVILGMIRATVLDYRRLSFPRHGLDERLTSTHEAQVLRLF